MRLTAVLLCAVLTGCAGSMSKISDIRESAPEWYEARKEELRGNAYPKLSQVPTDTTYRSRQTGLVKSAEEQAAIRKAFYADPRSELTYLTPDMILEWGADMRERVAAMDTPTDFLTENDIAMLKARFERPRARR